ncbi:MAG: hypothetical protein WCA37_17355 [Terracidiphilus sp.]
MRVGRTGEVPDSHREREGAKDVREDGRVAGVDVPAAVKGEGRSEEHDEAAHGIHAEST